MSSDHSLVSLLEKSETCQVMALQSEHVVMVKMKWAMIQMNKPIDHHFMTFHYPHFMCFFPVAFVSSVPASIPRPDGDADVTEATDMPGKAGVQWN